MIERWSKKNGYRDVLAISLPLAASMGSITLMQFTDRIFLANYSADAIAAALPIGVMIAPIYLAVEVFGAGLYVAWTIAACILVFKHRALA